MAKAQASYKKTVNQSPFGKKNNHPMPNDSLDAMRLDFMADYNNIMKDGSDEFGGDSGKKFMSGLKHSLTEKAVSGNGANPQRGGALSQMVAAG